MPLASREFLRAVKPIYINVISEDLTISSPQMQIFEDNNCKTSERIILKFSRIQEITYFTEF